ncbi:S8 family peptidase [Clostridium sp. SHJSY1]|uniref:S8 family peptidase n=1 Tax=Clostridium sp. SHJSY1 TaxID=2942483 RepID=UPI002876344F|nr:S8 family peptidase [Clostridium sp. SHJSY1]MDS0524552.1 S8 family peptidase [Clostridium sp. SHJSY1]
MNRLNETPPNIFYDINFDHYVVQYQGNILEDLSRFPDYYATIINERYAIISVKKDIEINITSPFFPTIVYVKPAEMYTLQEISPIEATQVDFLQLNLPLSLTGRGVNVAIIDSGIDYLSQEFIDSNGQTRIELIWDMTITTGNINSDINVPLGSIYTKDKIQEAINASNEGKSPYDIVPTRDILGHGTSMAGIVGASGKNPTLKGIAPECNFIVIKLIEDFSFEAQFNIEVPVFNVTVIFAALEFLNRYSLRFYKPLAICFPLGTNLGNHDGTDIIDQYIDSICSKTGVALITGSGNERSEGEHTSGIIPEAGINKEIEIDVSPEQKDLWAIEIWSDAPNILSIDVISPSGENTGPIRPAINVTETYNFLFEKTKMKINFYMPEENSGDQLIRIRIYKLQPGIWRIRITGEYILSGIFNAWMPQRGLTVGGTRFMPSDIYGTLTNPSNTAFIITAAAYNQNNNNIVNYSGVGFSDNTLNGVTVAAGGVNAVTVAPNNTTTIINGTSVSAAIVTGAVALLFQWGIVDGNDSSMYSQTIKTYLARGTNKRAGDIYPNAHWGYGILNIFSMFQNMR